MNYIKNISSQVLLQKTVVLAILKNSHVVNMCIDLLIKHFNILRRKYKQLYDQIKDNYNEYDRQNYKIRSKKYICTRFVDKDPDNEETK